MSRPTDGFSAMTSVFDIAEHHSDRCQGAILPLMALTETPSDFYRVVMGISIPIVEHLYGLRVSGVEHVPTEGGLVLAANHTSNLDPWPLGCALPKRQLHFMAKSELWQPGLRTVLAALGSFPVRRGEGDVEAFETAVRIVRGGGVMAMFPEGTRRSKGLRKKHQPRPHRGTVRIALAAGAPLVPAALLSGGVKHQGPASCRCSGTSSGRCSVLTCSKAKSAPAIGSRQRARRDEMA